MPSEMLWIKLWPSSEFVNLDRIHSVILSEARNEVTKNLKKDQKRSFTAFRMTKSRSG